MKFTWTDATKSNRKGVVGMVTAQVTSGEMKCPECGHELDEHDHEGCKHIMPNGDECICCLDKGEVALAILEER